ncbi:MAG TPA: hypothetical protein VEL28_05390 [Candidatus Binatia bacterium]|nr:hypothetical protein [Candidatus Binatia bacterium]
MSASKRFGFLSSPRMLHVVRAGRSLAILALILTTGVSPSSADDMTPAPRAVEGCGDGKCSLPDESVINCIMDCGCQSECGQFAPGLCGCDALCYEFDDCCPNACSQCGACCGNGTCDPSEDSSSCAQDCGCAAIGCGGADEGNCFCDADCAMFEDCCADFCSQCGGPSCCGNGTCEASEDSTTCRADCAICGDGICELDETAITCVQDCGCGADEYCGGPGPGGGCGCDAECVFRGDCCPDVCSECGVSTLGSLCCGSGTCDPGEDADVCAQDCGCAADDACGNAAPAGCHCDEVCMQKGDCCPDVCGACGSQTNEAECCGNDTCDPGEDASSCAADCGCAAAECGSSTPAPDGCLCSADCAQTDSCCEDLCDVCGGASCCGDAECGTGETHESCAKDCTCGDGQCGSGETHSNCPTDCKCGNGQLDVGEGCDGGDCCTDACSIIPAFTPCTADSDICTTEVCNAGGMCVGLWNTAPCNDGNECTTPDACSLGVCVGVPVCCGNGAIDPGEECDSSSCCTFECRLADAGTSCDDDSSPCDTKVCNAEGSCLATPTCCGNGTIEPGEDCDTLGACCSSACQFEAEGVACATDGIACTTDSCGDGDGQCRHVTNDAACDDGIACTVDACDSIDGCTNDSSACPSGVCADGVFNAGEECDDGNTATLDGCDCQCRDEVHASATVGAGGSIDTDSGDGPTADEPVTVSLTTPQPGALEITITCQTAPVPSGFAPFGPDVVTSAPAASEENPLVHVFSLDASLLPDGLGADPVQVVSQGVPLPACADDEAATPDPCVSNETASGEGTGASITDPRTLPPARAVTVLSTTAGTWSLAHVIADCGDANGSGTLNATDALFVLRGSVKLLICPLTLCDADGNGRVVATDALAVLRRAVGSDVNLACGERG